MAMNPLCDGNYIAGNALEAKLHISQLLNACLNHYLRGWESLAYIAIQFQRLPELCYRLYPLAGCGDAGSCCTHVGNHALPGVRLSQNAQPRVIVHQLTHPIVA